VKEPKEEIEVNFSPEEYDKLAKAAAIEGVTVEEFVHRAFKEQLEALAKDLTRRKDKISTDFSETTL
jgi:uncharacterized protein (DUF1778 family)